MQSLSKTTNPPPTPLSLECATELLNALPPVMRFVRKYMRCHKHKRLSVPQFRVMALLASAPAANLSAVAEFLSASLPNTSRIVAGLVDRGLVRRKQCTSDRRQLELALTPRGAGVMEQAREATQARLAEELTALGPAKVQTVLEAMRLLHGLFAPQLRSSAPDSSDDAATEHLKELLSRS